VSYPRRTKSLATPLQQPENMHFCYTSTNLQTTVFHFKLQYFKFAQFMVLDSCASKTNYFWQMFLLLSMLAEVTTITWSAAVKMLIQHEILLCLTLKVDECAARLLQSSSNGRQFSTNENYDRLYKTELSSTHKSKIHGWQF